MNHDDIRALELPSRYAAGRLEGDEEREFERHLVDCVECADAVSVELGLREGLRGVAGERATAARSSFFRLATAALLLLSVGLGAWAVRSTSALRQATAERSSLERRASNAETSASALQRELSDVRAGASKASKPEPAAIASAAVFALTTVRSGSPSDSPANRVTVAPDAAVVVLSMDVPDLPGATTFAVALKDRSGQEVWSGGDFRPAANGTINVAVDRGLLSSGDYLLELAQRAADGRVTPVSRFPLRVVAQSSR